MILFENIQGDSYKSPEVLNVLLFIYKFIHSFRVNSCKIYRKNIYKNIET